ncbi:MAG TPA: glycine cleavage system protein GcvH [Planctomycetota bacterium]|nr:glycine cleavage system protein GcvH [Planctomycetota bacterium]
MSNVLPGLKYSKEHEWVKVEGNVASIGITDHAQSQLGDIVFIELPKVGASVQYMKPMGVVESVKAASDIFSPLTGKVVAVNDQLTKTPEAVNKDCYGGGWMVKVEISKADELSGLMDDKAYAAFVAKA